MRRDSDERAAVMRIVEAESDAYLAKDYEAWAACWVKAPYVKRWVSTSRRGVNVWEGWDQQGPPMRRYMAEHPVPSTARYRREAVSVRVGTDMAWVTFDQYASNAHGPEVDVPELNHEMRILERGADGWKIACICSFQRSLDHVSSALVRVDKEGTVIWMNLSAQKELRDLRAVVVRAGRLRAVDRNADQRLQAAIRWAGYREDDGMWPRHGTLAVVLDSGRGVPASVCWVTARSGEVYVAINDPQMIEERLDAAIAVYGITPAQVRLARLIIAGHDLVDAAERLGVRVTTARTHLQRMFEKTGVRSQPALVRALLSAASPLE
jgi:DNA-binding CsgD family transcriptional regulator